ncbi:glycosyltransferase family 2 protein [Vallitalea pronyensis]|uniref:Glycosyltransferase family 2 protein n=1 Tax=Vallitalea pronyensis TaxID=1348613 RepID=A0A8J8MP57_9FIRM|nr:glycosyltransferase family 2 protein [Vallitalea pronyensis]QUI25011.1 glycosyltransferase family 2 protein [Vallitalea pronyensis]
MNIDNSSYKVSVIVPTYKRSQFLERAIESILNQSHTNIEVIVVDDNDPSSDSRKATEEKMQKYEANKKIVYIKNYKNMGGALARNEGVFKATGDFITFLDDDDIYLSDKIQLQLEFMIKDNYDLTFTDVRFHNTKGKLIDYREHKYIKHLSNVELLKQHIMHHLTPTATYMFKRQSILNIGGFDDVQVGQEFMLMLKAIENNIKIGYLPVARVIQYIHGGERISVGQIKLDKEVELFQFKQKYFPKLSSKQKRYVKFRHHAVMAVVGKRSGNNRIALSNLFLAICTSPSYSMKELSAHVVKLIKNRRLERY